MNSDEGGVSEDARCREEREDFLPGEQPESIEDELVDGGEPLLP